MKRADPRGKGVQVKSEIIRFYVHICIGHQYIKSNFFELSCNYNHSTFQITNLIITEQAIQFQLQKLKQLKMKLIFKSVQLQFYSSSSQNPPQLENIKYIIHYQTIIQSLPKSYFLIGKLGNTQYKLIKITQK
ncbi:unnamed protein product [Paramecium pentaurelia]|uniref:Uncharacterized protein n=1 Tax=Paramecium pentaurelia TaxID=43138 RepID=A0A8S1YHH2_9CILI|nr:unnamed protein product [Paramecium pentaurelia]